MEPERIGMSWTIEVTHNVHFPIAARTGQWGGEGKDSEPVKEMDLLLLGWFRYDLYHE